MVTRKKAEAKKEAAAKKKKAAPRRRKARSEDEQLEAAEARAAEATRLEQPDGAVIGTATDNTPMAREDGIRHRPTSPRRQLFIDEYLKDMNGAQAAIRAGYSERSARAIAYELLQMPEIHRAVRERLKEAAEKADITVEKVLWDLEYQRLLAVQKGDIAAANRASELQGKYHKMFVERAEVSVTDHEQALDELE